jgi:hypothetical protein
MEYLLSILLKIIAELVGIRWVSTFIWCVFSK